MSHHTGLRRWGIGLLVIGWLLAGWVPVRAQDPPPASARLYGFRHEYQIWCNCGPANLMMALSYYGWAYDQTYTAQGLKPSAADKNVSPWEMVDYVNTQDALPHLRAVWRYGGSLPVIRALIAAGFPVIVESGFNPTGEEWMGHYKTVVGYDDGPGVVWTYDSYMGAPLSTPYAEFEADWRHFNYAFLVIYPHDREPDVLASIGSLADPDDAAAAALEVAQQDLASDPADAWAWFNAGTSAVALAQYEDAAASYDAAFEIGLPFRMLWYQFGPYAAYYHTGRLEDVLRLADDTAAVTADIEETYYWRAMAFAALGLTDDAQRELDTALRFNPHFAAAKTAVAQIEASEIPLP
jgi:tetratricopeptide (TPR) repeat protein